MTRQMMIKSLLVCLLLIAAGLILSNQALMLAGPLSMPFVIGMAANTTPVHGKLGGMYAHRPNGFVGAGLNDLAWGTAAANAATAYYEVVLESTGTGAGGVDQFKWRKNGGAWTTGVDITGAAQALDEGQEITFAATTGHTLNDMWVAGNLVTEACTENGATAQITNAAHRVLDPDNPPTFTDSGGKIVERIDYSTGTAYFSGNVTAVTVSGNRGYVPSIAMQKVGYVLDWSLNAQIDMADTSAMGDTWKTAIAGLASASGSSKKYFIGNRTFLDELTREAAGTQRHTFLQLFSDDSAGTGTGDHFQFWAILTSLSPQASVGGVVNESLNFQVDGYPAFIEGA